MKKNTASYIGAWLFAAGLAFALAFASPNEASVMGRLPAFMSQTLLRQPVAIPEGLPAERTLALITFQKGQSAQIESWIEGMNLRNDPSITWMRMSVRNDPGSDKARSDFESRLLAHFKADSERAKLVPVFTDQDEFLRAAGLNSIDQVSAVVVNRQGDILARAEGGFDADKGQALRETLLHQTPSF